MDLLQKPTVWNPPPSNVATHTTPAAPASHPDRWDVLVRRHGALIAGALLTLLGLLALGIRGWQAGQDLPPSLLPNIPQETIVGPAGPITLRDYPDGRRWLTWYHENALWAGAPLWADHPFHELASCAGFVTTIICWNPKAPEAPWNLGQLRLGTAALTRAGLEPASGAIPADLVANYMATLQIQQVDTWYRFGRIQSPPIVMSDRAMQCYEFACLEWHIREGVGDPTSLKLVPLGQRATREDW
jgi:hypothetical protein